MDDVDVAPEVLRAAEELYGLPPGDFTARRTALAGELRKAGDKPSAGAVAGLRRPTVAAWLVNQLSRDDEGADQGAEQETGQGAEQGTGPGEASGRALLDRLLDLGEQTRQAQAALDGARIRELGRGRQALVASLVRRAGELGERHGQQVAAGVQRELEETFGAAIADPAAAAAVASGMLTRALAYAGLGDVDLEAATALTLPPGTALAPRPRPAGKARRHLAPVPDPAGSHDGTDGTDGDDPAAQRAAQQRADRARAEREAARAAEREAALAAARAEADAVEQALAAALDRQQQAQDHERELTRTVDRLQEELARARRDLVTASHAVGAAERDVVHRERAAREARKALARAERAADAGTDERGEETEA